MMATSSARGIHPSPMVSRIPIRIKNGNHVFPHRRACVLRDASLPGNGKSRLFVRHTRMGAGSGHSVKAMPCRAASRALTFMPWLPASYTRGRRTRKPPAGARSKEVRRPKAQRHKKAFPAAHGFPAYRHAAGITILARPPRLVLRRVLPIHVALPSARPSDVRAVMCVMPILPCVGYCLHGLRIAFRHSPHTVFP